jgi:hypothetical protein
VAPIRIDAGHFSPDTLAFIELLASRRVRYLIVGGEAVILHGHVRLTGDVDVFFSRDPDNIERLYSALDAFWDGSIPGIASSDDFTPEGMVVQFGVYRRTASTWSTPSTEYRSRKLGPNAWRR